MGWRGTQVGSRGRWDSLHVEIGMQGLRDGCKSENSSLVWETKYIAAVVAPVIHITAHPPG